MMLLLRAFFAAGLFFLGVVAMFMGIVVCGAYLKSGVISLEWGERADQSRDILLSSTPQDFWFYFALTGALPFVLGIAMVIAARRIERS